MKTLISALRIERLKARRSKVPLLTAVGFSLAPIAGGLFMIILKAVSYTHLTLPTKRIV